MKKYIYCVQYITKRFKRDHEHGLYIDADNAKEARQAFDVFYEYATREQNHKPHAFHITVKRVKDYEILDVDYMHIDAGWVLPSLD